MLISILLQILAFLISVRFGYFIVEYVKKLLSRELESEIIIRRKESEKLSIAIGYLERGIVFILAFTGNLEAVSWLFAAKSIARFRELENRKFAEYYLIGTLASILWAIICAIVAKWLISTSPLSARL